MHDQLRDALERQALPLSQRVLDQMYENPFWMERYGERGRRHADEDSRYHVTYLQQALALGSPAVFTNYALWLRSVLVSRGMCSEHLAENYRLLADAILEAQLPDAEAATRLLDDARQALRYSTGEAARLDAERDRLALVVAQVAPAMREDDVRYVVSYWIDGVATGDSTGFDTFVARLDAAVAAAVRDALRRL
jgi:hypothetical protein